jgi:poly(hydroxyalkanoate) depolymerase family esterase
MICFFVLLGISGLLLHSKTDVSASSSLWQRHTYFDLAGSRPYFVYTPKSYHIGVEVPLVVMLHGCTQTAADFAAGTRMNQLADQYTFIVVYPQQMSIYNQDLCWNWFESSNQVRGSGEPAIIAGIVKSVEQNVSQWTIDTHRVYVAGFSAGAAMAVILGAAYPDIFAAIGVHSGMEYQAASNVFDSLKAMNQGGPDPQQQGMAAFDAMGTTTGIVPTIVFQGASDQALQPINGDQVIQQWMRTDQLASSGTYTAEFDHADKIENGQVPFGHSYSVFKWNDSHDNEIQEYWKIYGMGHAWSGGSPRDAYTDSSGPDASMAMIQFFMGHSLL